MCSTPREKCSTPREMCSTPEARRRNIKLESRIDAGVDDYASAVKAITPRPALPSH